MQLYNWADTVIVGRYVGKQALAAVGASAPFVFMLVALVMGIGIGTTIIISQAYGLRDYDKIRKASDSLYLFLTAAAVAITALGLIFSRKIMILIDLPEDILPYAVSYLNIYLLGLIFLFFFNCLSSILRGIGDSRTPLIFLAVSAVLNILLDLLLVAVIPLGIEGAAWATVIAQAMAVTFAILYTNRRNDIVRFDPRRLVFDRRIFVRSLKLGIPAGVQQMFVAMGMLAIVSIVNSFDTDTVAAFSGASRIETLVSVIPMNLFAHSWSRSHDRSVAGGRASDAGIHYRTRGDRGWMRIPACAGAIVLDILVDDVLHGSIARHGQYRCTYDNNALLVVDRKDTGGLHAIGKVRTDRDMGCQRILLVFGNHMCGCRVQYDIA